MSFGCRETRATEREEGGGGGCRGWFSFSSLYESGQS